MKIFSSFDTKFSEKLLKEKRDIYGKNNVIIISYGKAFRIFKMYIPGIILAILTILEIYLLYNLIYITKNIIIYLFELIFFILNLYFIYKLTIKIIKHYIDYILDFVIVTPKTLLFYNQEGIFNRRGRTIDKEKIKTITVDRKGIIRSIFNYGSLTILTEGDEEGAGEIHFRYIDNPDVVKTNVMKIIEIH